MATKLHGLLNLSKINKDLITTLRNGDKAVWVDILERRNGPDQYGNTHTVTLYDAANRQTIYLGDFKPQEFGTGAASQTQAAATEQEENYEDLPF